MSSPLFQTDIVSRPHRAQFDPSVPAAIMSQPVDKTNPEVDHASVANESTIDKQHGEIREIQGDAHFHETITAAPLNAWSKTSFQLYCILLVAALNATASGFDGVSAQQHRVGR